MIAWEKKDDYELLDGRWCIAEMRKLAHQKWELRFSLKTPLYRPLRLWVDRPVTVEVLWTAHSPLRHEMMELGHRCVTIRDFKHDIERSGAFNTELADRTVAATAAGE